MGDATPATNSTQINIQPGSVAPTGSDEAAVVWAVRNWKLIIGVIGLVGLGGGSGVTALGQIDIAAEERVLRRQAAKKQSEQVRANGQAVAELHLRMGAVEAKISEHADITRTGLELLMASPAVLSAMESRPELKARAAKAVARGEK